MRELLRLVTDAIRTRTELQEDYECDSCAGRTTETDGRAGAGPRGAHFDPHHHFWHRPDDPYFLMELLRDLSGGHNIVRTVFMESKAMWRKDGPEELRPVGEIEFANGLAAQSASELWR